MEDKRFAHIGKDPKFRPIPRKEKKVKVDSRFNAMFNDDRFKLKYSVDKRGRPVNFTSKEQLEKFYDLESESEEEEKDPEENEKLKKTPKQRKQAKSAVGSIRVTNIGDEEEDEASGPEGSDTELPTDVKSKIQDLSCNYLRGEVEFLTESSSDESESEEIEDEEVYHNWGELDKDAERTEEPTRRIAVCNMDWDRIRAVDLFLVLHSFAPQGDSFLKCKH